MSNVVVNIFRIPDLRKRVLFTLAILILYRIGAHIPVPGINVEALKVYFLEAQSTGVLDFFDLFAGGALKRFTLFALGIMPYISASIIIDLLKVVFPALERLSKEGAEGYKKISQYTRYGTVLLCIVQSMAITFWMKSMKTRGGGSVVPEDAGIGFIIVAVVAITTGTMVLVWLGEMITERGVGNGVSLIIMAGIVVRSPQALASTMRKIGDTGEPIVGIILLGLFLLVVAASILLTLGTRRIPVQYGKKMAGRTMMQKSSQYIPLRVNAAGVIPIIFASALIIFPSQMVSLMGGSSNTVLNKVQFWLSPGQVPYMIIYSGLIIFFCYFYTSIRFNPVEIADNLKKYGGFIPGIRPGQNTADYILNILNRITLSGSIFLALIAIVPDFIIRIWPEQVEPGMAYLFGGTSLLIIVGVALDTLKQIESQLLMRHYDGFLKNGRMKGRR
ncbi:MAG TPA: preprotein translocase subunit SecY [Spirochaetota bacterium]|mgnify:CR=1 FL=1|nr:preprotein translocase subunit SecY [Spirochaetota bacterium]HPI88052.1 preprotein translocase subunit SecY [Spirochaetota bacterium]HPR46463.1 preprotein translocase subunit SecY [Spirochaetota bacterium]